MSRYKLTNEILQDIEDYAEDQYTLKDLFEELNISKKLMKDKRVLEAFEKGVIKFYISMASSGMSDLDIADNFEINIDLCNLWSELYNNEIKQGLEKKEEDEKLATKQFSNPIMSGMINILEQNGEGMPPVSKDVLHDDIQKMVDNIQNGDTKELLTILTTNILQLQLFNGRVTHNLMGDAGKQLDNFNKLSNMQLKVMQETRKSIMSINEITNPKRTTFIKEANQHNHLHQNSEKKYENKNELQKPDIIDKSEAISDAELIPLKEGKSDNKLS